MAIFWQQAGRYLSIGQIIVFKLTLDMVEVLRRESVD
jgi:hypothetical protein